MGLYDTQVPAREDRDIGKGSKTHGPRSAATGSGTASDSGVTRDPH